MYELLETKNVRGALVVLAACGALAANPAQAADGSPWEQGDFSAKASVVGFLLDSDGEVTLAGAPFPGAGIHIGDGVTAAVDLEYFATSNFSVAVNFGLPIAADINGTGALAGFGPLGEVDYGIGATTVRYHIDTGTGVVPYVGAGVGRLFIFDETDAVVSNLNVESAWAPVVQGGVNVFMGENFGLYANVSYAPLKTDATGIALGAPTHVRVTLDPTVVQGGLFYRF